jgi:hypothetical protein
MALLHAAELDAVLGDIPQVPVNRRPSVRTEDAGHRLPLDENQTDPCRQIACQKPNLR